MVVTTRGRRRLGLAAVVAVVLAVHAWLAGDVLDARLGRGSADARPQRMEVRMTRELQQADAPPVAPAPAAADTGRRPSAQPPRAAVVAAATAAAAAASAADGAAAAAAPDVPAGVATTVDDATAAADAAASAPTVLAQALPASSPADASAAGASSPAPLQAASASASAPAAVATTASASAPAFAWPPSTRLQYRLTGNYRGPVDGQAQVEWLQRDGRYQVHLEISVGPPFAPLLSRRITSEGDVTPRGLSPRRYDEETKVVLRSPRRLAIEFLPEVIRLPSGQTMLRPSGVQDSASQFVQLTWLFTTRPELLQPGRSIELPLALPRRVEPWIYDVLGNETLVTPAGRVPAVHVKPRREGRPPSADGGDLTAEVWVAPTLQYLPVRILIRQDADTFVDLLLERLPQQEAPAEPAAPADVRR